MTTMTVFLLRDLLRAADAFKEHVNTNPNDFTALVEATPMVIESCPVNRSGQRSSLFQEALHGLTTFCAFGHETADVVEGVR